MTRHNVFRDGRVHVCAEMCPTCIFRPGNLMGLNSGRVRGMVDEARKNESRIPCHHQIYLSKPGEDACCRGFFDRYPTQPLQIAERLGLITFITPQPKEDNANPDRNEG